MGVLAVGLLTGVDGEWVGLLEVGFGGASWVRDLTRCGEAGVADEDVGLMFSPEDGVVGGKDSLEEEGSLCGR